MSAALAVKECSQTLLLEDYANLVQSIRQVVKDPAVAMLAVQEWNFLDRRVKTVRQVTILQEMVLVLNVPQVHINQAQEPKNVTFAGAAAFRHHHWEQCRAVLAGWVLIPLEAHAKIVHQELPVLPDLVSVRHVNLERVAYPVASATPDFTLKEADFANHAPPIRLHPLSGHLSASHALVDPTPHLPEALHVHNVVLAFSRKKVVTVKRVLRFSMHRREDYVNA